MNILFYTVGGDVSSPESVSDYQLDAVLHGLYSLGHNVRDAHNRWHLYQDSDRRNNHLIWGKNFTFGNTIKQPAKEPNDYDLVIFGLHHTFFSTFSRDQQIKLLDFLDFEYRDIPHAIIDGWDRTYINEDLLKYGAYFKRELADNYADRCYPIDFAIPEEKINLAIDFSKKNKEFAPLIPVNQSINPKYMQTYVHDTEKSYYEMYATSWFGLTSCKGGWNTMRHLEIVANACIPVFVDIKKCPENILSSLPRDLLEDILSIDGLHINLSDAPPEVRNQWAQDRYMPHCGYVDLHNPGYFDGIEKHKSKLINIIDRLQTHALNFNTTSFIANYVIKNTMEHYA